ncbi:MAG: hypothetical protein KBB83_04135 [Alphaproteobacteria bacterium]|nr:hypothetical protein [Alphaproteobacteria bacterium]
MNLNTYLLPLIFFASITTTLQAQESCRDACRENKDICLRSPGTPYYNGELLSDEEINACEQDADNCYETCAEGASE